MKHEEVTKEHMDALKALADTNLQVSEAQNTLNKLKETRDEYLASRKKEALLRVENTLALSKDLIEETNKNYEAVSDFARIIHDGGRFLSEAHEAFQELNKSKEEHYTLWERDIKKQEEKITELMKGIKIKENDLSSKSKQMDEKNKKFREDARKIRDDRAEVERAIIRLKEKRV